jgi:hypothetical protein
MWYLKIVERGGKEWLQPCDSYTVTRYAPGSVALQDFCERTGASEEEAAGIEIDILVRRNHETGDAERKTLLIPRDAEAVHAMDEKGRIIDGYRWPPRTAATGAQAEQRREVAR